MRFNFLANEKISTLSCKIHFSRHFIQCKKLLLMYNCMTETHNEHFPKQKWYLCNSFTCGLQLLKFTQQSVAFKEDFPELLLALHNFPRQEWFESATFSYFRSNLWYYIKKKKILNKDLAKIKDAINNFGMCLAMTCS